MLKSGRILLVGLLASLVALFYATGLQQHVHLDKIEEQQTSLQGLYSRRPVVVSAVFSATCIPVVALSTLSPGLIVSLALLGLFPLLVRRGLGRIRKRYHRSAVSRNTVAIIPGDSPLAALQQGIGELCSECGACRKSCGFLKHYGTPKRIATHCDFSTPAGQAIAYECSLCGLCTAVCPEKLDPARLFLEVRRRCVEDGNLDESAYRTILAYEKWGASPLFSWYGLPEGCDTVFFPGCTLPGTRPGVTTDLFRQIRKTIPTVGLVLDCCAKPSHDLGRTEYFHGLFGEMCGYLTGRGIRTVLTACPNCTTIFRQYGHGLAVRTVYEFLHANGRVSAVPATGDVVTVHDPCALRDDLPTRQAVRALLVNMGHTLVEMEHHGELTLCCGEGGMVGAVNPKRAGEWALIRRKEAGGRRIVTYCVGCSGYLNRVAPTVHIADLICRPEAAHSGNLNIARAPLTYWHRLCLKRRMKREIRPMVQRTRPAIVSAPAISRSSRSIS